MARAFNLPFVWGTAADLDGRSLSVARDAKVPAIYAEYRGAATMDPAGIDAYVEGCLNVMGDMQMLGRPAPPCRIEHLVEDPTPGSGHMQVCHPAPAAGLFEPHVKLGDHVQRHQPIGVIRELNPTVEHVVPADKTGMVIVLKTFPRVRQGESIGVVVEVDNNMTLSLLES